MNKVKLVSLTKPNIEGITTTEDIIAYCARVSNPSNQLNLDTSSRLLTYCIKHKHWSPFEMVDMTVEIKTSRAIAAQLLRHRSFSFQEFSQRYSEVSTIEDIELRKQGKTNRQVGEEPFDPLIGDFKNTFTGTVNGVPASEIISIMMKRNLQLYNDLIAAGVARESARMILPLSTTTTLYMKGSIRSWIHYLELRTAPETQKEHRILADEIKEIFTVNFPVISKALNCVD